MHPRAYRLADWAGSGAGRHEVTRVADLIYIWDEWAILCSIGLGLLIGVGFAFSMLVQMFQQLMEVLNR